LNKYEVVQVYDIQEAGTGKWLMVAPDEWVEQTNVGRVYPNPTPPEGVSGCRWIEVNLYEQTMAVYDNCQLVYATLIASGVDKFWTRPGLFQIYRRLEAGVMSGAFEADRSDYYYLEDVPYTMYYDDARALHGAYWRTALGFQQSHGCVNMAAGDAHWLYNWAQVGDWVYVWDPSGETPIDPDAYDQGGA
jgi:lipoprotein-anchoring transpeptidase ErfK/SrfK